MICQCWVENISLVLTFPDLFARMEPVTAAHALWHPALLDPHKKTSGTHTVRSPAHTNASHLVVKVILMGSNDHVHWHHVAADRILQGSAGLHGLCIIHKCLHILCPFFVYLFNILVNLIMPWALFYHVKIHSTEFPSKKKHEISLKMPFGPGVREMSPALLFQIWLPLLEAQIGIVQN